MSRILVCGDSLIQGFLGLGIVFGVDPISIGGGRVGDLFRHVGYKLNQVDCMFLHIGVNDISSGSSVDALASDFLDLFDCIFNYNPSLKLVVSSVFPRFENHYGIF